MRALIADDDRIATTKLSRTLAKWNFDVSLAHDGESAWSSIQTQAPQLAIVDWMMPALDGLGLCRRIRQDATTAHMYLILLTSRDSRADVVSGLDAERTIIWSSHSIPKSCGRGSMWGCAC